MGHRRGGVLLFEGSSVPLNVTRRIVLRMKEVERQVMAPLKTFMHPFFPYLKCMRPIVDSPTFFFLPSLLALKLKPSTLRNFNAFAQNQRAFSEKQSTDIL